MSTIIKTIANLPMLTQILIFFIFINIVCMLVTAKYVLKWWTQTIQNIKIMNKNNKQPTIIKSKQQQQNNNTCLTRINNNKIHFLLSTTIFQPIISHKKSMISKHILFITLNIWICVLTLVNNSTFTYKMEYESNTMIQYLISIKYTHNILLLAWIYVVVAAVQWIVTWLVVKDMIQLQNKQICCESQQIQLQINVKINNITPNKDIIINRIILAYYACLYIISLSISIFTILQIMCSHYNQPTYIKSQLFTQQYTLYFIQQPIITNTTNFFYATDSNPMIIQIFICLAILILAHHVIIIVIALLVFIHHGLRNIKEKNIGQSNGQQQQQLQNNIRQSNQQMLNQQVIQIMLGVFKSNFGDFDKYAMQSLGHIQVGNVRNIMEQSKQNLYEHFNGIQNLIFTQNIQQKQNKYIHNHTYKSKQGLSTYKKYIKANIQSGQVNNKKKILVLSQPQLLCNTAKNQSESIKYKKKKQIICTMPNFSQSSNSTNFKFFNTPKQISQYFKYYNNKLNLTLKSQNTNIKIIRQLQQQVQQQNKNKQTQIRLSNLKKRKNRRTAFFKQTQYKQSINNHKNQNLNKQQDHEQIQNASECVYQMLTKQNKVSSYPWKADIKLRNKNKYKYKHEQQVLKNIENKVQGHMGLCQYQIAQNSGNRNSYDLKVIDHNQYKIQKIDDDVEVLDLSDYTIKDLGCISNQSIKKVKNNNIIIDTHSFIKKCRYQSTGQIINHFDNNNNTQNKTPSSSISISHNQNYFYSRKGNKSKKAPSVPQIKVQPFTFCIDKNQIINK